MYGRKRRGVKRNDFPLSPSNNHTNTKRLWRYTFAYRPAILYILIDKLEMRFPRILIGIIGISSFFKFDISASVYRFIYDSIAVETLSFREILSIRVVRLISISHASPATILTRVERNRIQNRCPTPGTFQILFHSRTFSVFADIISEQFT